MSNPPSPFTAIITIIIIVMMLGVIFYLTNLLNGIAYIIGKALNVSPSATNALGLGVSGIMPIVLYSIVSLLIVIIIIALIRAVRGE